MRVRTPSRTGAQMVATLRQQANTRGVRCKSSLQKKEVTWDSALRIKGQLSDAIAIQDFLAAARLRDELADLELSAVQQMELDCVHQLLTGDVDDQKNSLAKLRQLCPVSEQSQAAIAECLKDEQLAEAAEAALKDIWGRHPSNPQVTELMQEGIAQLQRPADLTDALATFAKAAQLDPMFAEAQNKKATVLFLLHRWQDSIDVCETVLQLNPLHYAALSGKALCHVSLQENDKAIACFRRALEINPFMKQVRERLAALELSEREASSDS